MKNLWTKIFVVAFVAYIIFSVGRVIYQGYQINNEVKGLKAEIEGLQKTNKQLEEQILYYQSPSYREKIARERLGLQKPGEQVIVIVPEKKPKETDANPDDKLPNYLKWWNFFFKNS